MTPETWARLLPDGATGPAGCSAADKFAAVVETAVLNAAELQEYCRAWRREVKQTNEIDMDTIVPDVPASTARP